jgi:pimeloyl-ACP methyl ester carboxylesterase
MGATVTHEASKRTIPGTPVPVPGSLTAVAMLIADLRWDIDWRGIGYVERAGDIIEIPTLVFHGVDDDRVSIEVSRRLRDQAPDQIRLIEVEEAGHVTSWNVDPEAYERALAQFLDDHARPSSG